MPEPIPEMMTLSTGEVIARDEWVRRINQRRDEVERYWRGHPEEAAAMQRRYAAAMRADPNKD